MPNHKFTPHRHQSVKVKTAKGRKISSTLWLQRQLNDPYAIKAKQEGYFSRAAYKLLEIDAKFHILGHGKTIIDLGASPGSWTQIALRTDPKKIIAVDLVKMKEIDGVQFILGDFTDEATLEKIYSALRNDPHIHLTIPSSRRRPGPSPTNDSPKGSHFVDFALKKKENTYRPLGGIFVGLGPGLRRDDGIVEDDGMVDEMPRVDIILSDMAPNTSGHRDLDHLIIIDLGEHALEFAKKTLAKDGSLIMKTFQGGGEKPLADKLKKSFSKVKFFKPKASRKDSTEIFLVATGFM